MNQQISAAERALYRRSPLDPQIFRGFLRALDPLIVALGGLLAFLVAGPAAGEGLSTSLNAIAVTALVSIVMFGLFDCYGDDLIFAKVPRLKQVAGAWLASAGTMLLMAYGLGVHHRFQPSWAQAWFVSVLVLLMAERTALALLVTRLGRHGVVTQRSVIVGAGEIGRRLADHLSAHADGRIQILGIVDDRRTRVAPSVGGYPVIGTTEELVTLIREERVEQVFIALPWSAESRIKSILMKLAVLPVHVRLAPDLISFNFTDRPVSTVGGLPLLHIFERPISGWSFLAKSIEDRVIAAIFLLFALPVMLIIAAVIKLETPGPVFFRQMRHGFNNKLIQVLKFRTMYADQADHGAEKQTARDDPRVTPFGRFLRRTSLDELPQFINVLTGSMSIVGPRPHPIAMRTEGLRLPDVVEEYAARHKVKPGITGWAQVNGWRGEADTVQKIKKRVEHDLYYIENWSIGLDLWIMLRTVFKVFHDPKAY